MAMRGTIAISTGMNASLYASATASWTTDGSAAVISGVSEFAPTPSAESPPSPVRFSVKRVASLAMKKEPTSAEPSDAPISRKNV